MTPRPKDDNNNFQPRFGFSWNPHTDPGGWLGWLTGGDKFVFRGGYARTNDYQFINLALNVASSFPFVAAISMPGLPNAFTILPGLEPSLTAGGSGNAHPHRSIRRFSRSGGGAVYH